jgi:hypothetical protein
MNRILRRPMFRMGGTPNEGIMTGLKKSRVGYADGTPPDAVSGIATQLPQASESPGFFTKIKDAVFPPSGVILERIQERQRKEAEMKSPFNQFMDYLRDKPIEFRTEEDANKFLEKNPNFPKRIKILETDEILNAGLETEEPEKKIKKGTKNEEAPVGKTPSDLDTYKEILNLYKSELSASDDELKRQRFLELAKFGANLAAQPGGSLTQAIGSSAAKSLEGLTRIEEAKRKQDQTAKALALETAIKQLEPGTIAKQVRDIKRLNPKLSDVEALDKVISGTATKGRTQETRIGTYADNLYEDDIVESKTAGRKAAEAIEESGYGIGRFNKDPGEGSREVGTYYILKDGRIGKYKGKDKTGKEDFSSPGDEDF